MTSVYRHLKPSHTTKRIEFVIDGEPFLITIGPKPRVQATTIDDPDVRVLTDTQTALGFLLDRQTLRAVRDRFAILGDAKWLDRVEQCVR